MAKHNMDTGYSWVILAACASIQFLTDGIMRSFGLYYVEILDMFRESMSVTTFIMGIMNGVFCLSTMPVMMYLIKLISPRQSVMIGGILMALGYSLSCFANNIYFMFFSLSFLVGCGMALVYGPSVVVLGTYFSKRRAMANGIAVSGCCMGGLLCPALYRYLLDTYGLRGTLLLTGAVVLHNVPMACLLRPNKTRIENDAKYNCKIKLNSIPEEDLFLSMNTKTLINSGQSEDLSMAKVHRHDSDKCLFDNYKIVDSTLTVRDVDTLQWNSGHALQNEGVDNNNFSKTSQLKYVENHDEIETKGRFTQGFSRLNMTEQKNTGCPSAFSPCLNMTFILFLFANTFATTIVVTFLPFLPLHAKENDLDDTQIVILVSLTGAFDFIGRIVSGVLVDRSKIKTYHILAVSQAICGVACNCNPLMTSFPGLIIFCLLIGLFEGMQLTLMLTHIFNTVGLTLGPSALSIAFVCQLPTFIFGPLVFGFLRDATGNFKASYHVTGVIALLSALLYLCEPLTNRFRNDTLHVKKKDNK